MIYNFLDPRDYLGVVFEEKKKRNSAFSIRAWSKMMGHNNSDLLSKILTKKRILSEKQADIIIDFLDISEDEKKYFKVLVMHLNAKKESNKEIYLELLSRLNPMKEVVDLSLDCFKYISDWHHVAIIEMTKLKDFLYDIDFIHQRLDKKVSKTEIKAAIDRLLRLEILEEEDNTLRKSKYGHLKFGEEIPSSAIRNHHYQMVTKAGEAIHHQKYEDRIITGSTLTMKKEDMEKARELIADFSHQVIKSLSSKDGDQVYQYNMQFFKLTQGEAQ